MDAKYLVPAATQHVCSTALGQCNTERAPFPFLEHTFQFYHEIVRYNALQCVR